MLDAEFDIVLEVDTTTDMLDDVEKVVIVVGAAGRRTRTASCTPVERMNVVGYDL